MTTFILERAVHRRGEHHAATQFNTIQAVATPGLELQVITASMVGGVHPRRRRNGHRPTLAAILIRFIGSALVFVDIRRSR